MKIKDGFMTRKIGDKIVGVAVGDRALTFNGMINLNETGEFIWDCLKNDTTIDEVATKINQNYEVSFEDAKECAINFVNTLKENDLLD